MAPKNLGNIGYDGESGLFVPSAVQSKAYEAEGINLDFYRDYNVSWHMPGRYFTNPDYLDVSTLLPCISTSLMTPETMKTYLDLTGDLEGVEIRESSAAGAAGASVIGRCFDNYFWYSPACRTEASACVSCLTGGTGWAVHEIMGKATAHNMPVAIAVASSFQNYANVPKSLDLMLYWWVPDPTFLRRGQTERNFHSKGCGPLYGEQMDQIGICILEFHGSERYSSQSSLCSAWQEHSGWNQFRSLFRAMTRMELPRVTSHQQLQLFQLTNMSAKTWVCWHQMWWSYSIVSCPFWSSHFSPRFWRVFEIPYCRVLHPNFSAANSAFFHFFPASPRIDFDFEEFGWDDAGSTWQHQD